MIKGIGELGTLVTLMLPPNPGSWSKAVLIFYALAETLAIAFLGTLLAAIIAFPIGFVAARLLWINVVGLGPFAGVLAIMTSDIGTFGKLFSEAIEAADKRPVEGVTSTGGSRLHQIRYGIIPQILPVIGSQVLYYFESNTRSSTIIGIVGAGGIGLHLSEQIRTLEWQSVSFIILLILAMVAVIDLASSQMRQVLIGRATQDRN
jgi:phosphonate transport system permease protein